MALQWKIKLLRPQQALNKFARDAWAKTTPEIGAWIKSDLIPALIFGGMNIKGIAQTDFYKFVSSDEGLSQLGIEKSEPPKLLRAYEQTAFKIKTGRTFVELMFGDTAKLRIATPHPASGTGHLQVESWLEWVFDEVAVAKGYVPRGDLPAASQNSIRLGSPLGGLMLAAGALGKSTGNWAFPPALTHYDDDWFNENAEKIQIALTNRAVKIFSEKLIHG